MHRIIAEKCANHTGISKSQNIRFFNEAYIAGTSIHDKNRSCFTYSKPVDAPIEYPEYNYLSMVLDLCLKSDICSKLGLSVSDFMQMDLGTFKYIQETYYKHKPKEQKEIENILKDMPSMK